MYLQEKPIGPEPITVEEVIEYARLDDDQDRGLIIRLISTAREEAEKYLGISLIHREISAIYSGSLPQKVILPKSPITSVNSVVLDDSIAHEKWHRESDYAIQHDRIIFKRPPYAEHIIINYTAGYNEALPLPNSLRQALILHVTELYHQRSAASTGIALLRQIYHKFRQWWV